MGKGNEKNRSAALGSEWSCRSSLRSEVDIGRGTATVLSTQAFCEIIQHFLIGQTQPPNFHHMIRYLCYFFGFGGLGVIFSKHGGSSHLLWWRFRLSMFFVCSRTHIQLHRLFYPKPYLPLCLVNCLLSVLYSSYITNEFIPSGPFLDAS